MPPIKSKPTKGSKSSKGAKAKPAKSVARVGPLPPYGVPIREAMARSDKKEMQKLATTTRKYLKDIQSALDALEKAISK